MQTFFRSFSRFMALLGGGVLLILVVLTCVSVFGRSLNTIGHTSFVADNLGFLASILTRFGPINGDYEIVEAGIAFAILSFFPWCSLNRGHATVDIFASFLPGGTNRLLIAFWEIIFAIALVVISWRLYVGMSDKMRYGETTFLLQLPIWWGYAACFVASLAAAIVAVYSAYLRVRELGSGNSGENPSDAGGAIH